MTGFASLAGYGYTKQDPVAGATPKKDYSSYIYVGVVARDDPDTVISYPVLYAMSISALLSIGLIVFSVVYIPSILEK